jgi:hypothetical protein
MKMGYKRFMLGDAVCFRKESVKAALGLFDKIQQEYDEYGPSDS